MQRKNRITLHCAEHKHTDMISLRCLKCNIEMNHVSTVQTGDTVKIDYRCRKCGSSVRVAVRSW